MDSAVKVAVQGVYYVFFERLRVYAVEHIHEDDISLGQIKNQLQTEFEKINAKIDRLANAPVLAAQDYLTSGLNYLHHNPHDLAVAKEKFNEALKNSILGFRTATTFELKTVAIKIRILATLHIHDFFMGNPTNEFICSEVMAVWNEFCHLPEIESSVRDEFNGSIFRLGSSSAARREYLAALATLRNDIISIIGLRLPINDSRGNEVNLELVNPLRLTAHSGYVKALIIYNGRLYSASGDGVIKAWDIAPNSMPSKPVLTLAGHTDGVNVLVIEKGKLYSGSDDKTIKVWDIASVSNTHLSAGPLTTLTGHDKEVISLIIDNGRLFSGSQDKTIKVWDIASSPLSTKLMLTLTGHNFSVTALITDQGRLYSGSGDCTIKVWDISSSPMPTEAILTLTGQTSTISSLIIDKGRLYSGSRDNTIKVWDISSSSMPPAPIVTLAGHTNQVNTLAVDTVKGRLYSGSEDKTIKVWDIASSSMPAEPIVTLKGNTREVLALAVDKGRLYSGSADSFEIAGTINFRLC